MPRAGSGAIGETRPAAVLVPIFEEAGEARVILTKRPETMPSHQGEIAVPGGKYEPADPDLRATALREAHEEIGLDPGLVDDVVMGCVMQVGEQAFNVGRNAVLAAGWPDSVPGTTIDRQCGSSQQAAHFAAQGVIAGAYDVVVAAGVEVMTRVPMGSAMADGKYGFPFGPAVSARYAPEGGLVPQGISAELIAEAPWPDGRPPYVSGLRRLACGARDLVLATLDPSSQSRRFWSVRLTGRSGLP